MSPAGLSLAAIAKPCAGARYRMPRQAHSLRRSWCSLRLTGQSSHSPASHRVRVDVGRFGAGVHLVAWAQRQSAERLGGDLGDERQAALDTDTHTVADAVDLA